MRVLWVLPGALLLCVIAAAAIWWRPIGTWSIWFGRDAAVGVCSTDDQISIAERQRMQQAADAFLHTLANAPDQVGPLLTDEFRAMSAQLPDFSRRMGPVHGAVAHAYLLQFSSGAQHGTAVPCGEVSAAAFINRGGAWKSGVVQFVEPVRRHDERIVSVWMDFEHHAWRVRAVRFNLSKLNGRDAARLWSDGRAQRARGHLLNAMMLYAAANGLLDPEGFVQPSMAQAFRADRSTLPQLSELHPPLPALWAEGGQDFNITKLEFSGFDSGEVALIVDYRVEVWRGDENAAALNHILIDGFNKRYPEWPETFDGIIARANRPDGSGSWATVFTRNNGYAPPRSGPTTTASAPRTPATPAAP